MALARRTSPGMVVVPNAGQIGVQTFNFQGSGFTQGASLDICWRSPRGVTTCNTAQHADEYGVAGFGVQVASGSTGTWTVSMCEHGNPLSCTPTKTFTVLP